MSPKWHPRVEIERGLKVTYPVRQQVEHLDQLRSRSSTASSGESEVRRVVIDPTSTVTALRAALGLVARAAPQLGQNLASATFSLPHSRHRSIGGA